MIITTEYLSKINPKTSKINGKYSPNVYNYLKNNLNKEVKVYNPRQEYFGLEGKDENGKDKIRPFIITDFMRGENGKLDGMGVYVRSIIRSNKKNNHGKINKMFFDDLNDSNIYEDISEQWFADYIKKGRCLFVGHNETWISNAEDRFTEPENGIKTCKYCGKKLYLQKRLVETFVWVE